MGYLALSLLAVSDLEDIERYSMERWGEPVAARYMGAIETALRRLKAHPELLRDSPEIFRNLKFYRVEKHYLVCAVVMDNIYVLTVKHGAMNLPERLAELEPLLEREAEILHRAFLESLKD